MASSSDRGILSERDRRYLSNPDEFEAAHARTVRSYIRNRLIHAVPDFGILENLEERDREQVFDKLVSGDVDGVSEEEIRDGFKAMAAFLFEGAIRLGIPAETLVIHGVKKAMERRTEGNVIVRVGADVDIDIVQPSDQQPQIEEIAQKLDEGYGIEDLNPGEQATILRQLDRLEDFDPAREAIEEWRRVIDETDE